MSALDFMQSRLHPLSPMLQRTATFSLKEMTDWMDAAIQAERERCAKIAESMIGANRREIADAIRRGGEHEHNE